jgi:hypothetical protein
MRKVLLLVSTTALVAGIAGTAYAESFTAQSLVQQDNASCGHFVEGFPIIGSAKFTRTFNTLKITYTAKHLATLTGYGFEVYNATAGVCEFLAEPAEFVTTATGVGKVTASIEVPEKDYEFFATAFGAGAFNDSFIVTLPRP